MSFTGNWEYKILPTLTDPNMGEVVHADSALEVLAFNFLDGDLADRNADMATVAAGTTITNTTDNVKWLATAAAFPVGFVWYVPVAPGVQGPSGGVKAWEFTPAVQQLTVADVATYLAVDESKINAPQCELVIAGVERHLSDFYDVVTAPTPWKTSSPDLYQAALMMVARYRRRPESPLGTITFEGFESRVVAYDGDINRLLSRYARNEFA